MDWERHKITAETTMIRGRGWANLLIRMGGIALLVIGALNLMLFTLDPIFPFYRELFYSFAGGPGVGGAVLADLLAMSVGAIVAHFL